MSGQSNPEGKDRLLFHFSDLTDLKWSDDYQHRDTFLAKARNYSKLTLLADSLCQPEDQENNLVRAKEFPFMLLFVASCWLAGNEADGVARLKEVWSHRLVDYAVKVTTLELGEVEPAGSLAVVWEAYFYCEVKHELESTDNPHEVLRRAAEAFLATLPDTFNPLTMPVPRTNRLFQNAFDWIAEDTRRFRADLVNAEECVLPYRDGRRLAFLRAIRLIDPTSKMAILWGYTGVSGQSSGQGWDIVILTESKRNTEYVGLSHRAGVPQNTLERNLPKSTTPQVKADTAKHSSRNQLAPGYWQVDATKNISLTRAYQLPLAEEWLLSKKEYWGSFDKFPDDPTLNPNGERHVGFVEVALQEPAFDDEQHRNEWHDTLRSPRAELFFAQLGWSYLHGAMYAPPPVELQTKHAGRIGRDAAGYYVWGRSGVAICALQPSSDILPTFSAKFRKIVEDIGAVVPSEGEGKQARTDIGSLRRSLVKNIHELNDAKWTPIRRFIAARDLDRLVQEAMAEGRDRDAMTAERRNTILGAVGFALAFAQVAGLIVYDGMEESTWKNRACVLLVVTVIGGVFGALIGGWRGWKTGSKKFSNMPDRV